MTSLPPEDLPPAQLFVPGTDEEFIAQIGPMTMQNERAVAFAFFSYLVQDGGPDVGRLRTLVTPESSSAWGDFRKLAAAADSLSLATMGNRAVGRDDVHYFVLLADTPDAPSKVAQDTVLSGRVVLTLQRRSDLDNEWRVHQAGEYAHPDDLPWPTK